MNATLVQGWMHFLQILNFYPTLFCVHCIRKFSVTLFRNLSLLLQLTHLKKGRAVDICYTYTYVRTTFKKRTEQRMFFLVATAGRNLTVMLI